MALVNQFILEWLAEPESCCRVKVLHNDNLAHYSARSFANLFSDVRKFRYAGLRMIKS